MTTHGISISGRGHTSVRMLSALLDGIAVVSPEVDCEINGVVLDSRCVATGDVFIALKGDTVHGLEFLPSVIASGAVAVLVDSQDEKCGAGERTVISESSVVLIEVDGLAALAGVVASRYFGNPSSSLKVVGVTGTDGKTSVCHLLGQALNVNRSNCGVLGTLGWGFGSQMQSTGLTTPDTVVLQSALAEMLEAGAKTVAMEVSSHSLAQLRVNGILFDVAVLTNIGRDHLDYHGDMQSYREAKKTLFYKAGLRAAVINADDEFGALLLEQLPGIDVFSYGAQERQGCHIRFCNVNHLASGLSFELQYESNSYSVTSGLIGDFNVQNITATFAVLVALGISPELAAESLSNLKPVPGRMEATRLNNGAVVIVDYAHNPHALESVLGTVSNHCEGKLIVVFGCGGDTEPGDEIVAQIMEGFKVRQNVNVERDRKSAIQLAMSKAGSGDFVVVAGKGHEDYQLIGDQRLPFSDITVVGEYAGAMQ